jgi:hypothetical protein
MVARPRASLAAAALVAAVLLAGPARAGGPAQPPDGQFAGFVVKHLIPPFFLDTFGTGGQCLAVTCWSTSHTGFSYGFQLWDGNTNPNRAPVIETSTFADGLTDLDTIFLCPGGESTSAAGRV